MAINNNQQQQLPATLAIASNTTSYCQQHQLLPAILATASNTKYIQPATPQRSNATIWIGRNKDDTPDASTNNLGSITATMHSRQQLN